MFVKICANTNLEDALLAVKSGADAVGFVFAPSKRQVTTEQVKEITLGLSEAVMKVGVFDATDPEEILQAASGVGLNAVQLHSAFNPGLVEAIEAGSGGMLRVLQVVDVPASMEMAELRASLTRVLQHPYVSAVLLDASHDGISGGTGKVFDWERTATVVRQVQQETGGRVIVAGGLRPENVGEAIAAFAPWGVDVASGVEATPGRKSPEKLWAFIEEARHAAAAID